MAQFSTFIIKAKMARKVSLVIVILALLTAGIWFYLSTRKSTDFEPLIKSKLQQVVKDGSNGLYDLSLDHVEVDVLKSTVDLKNLSLKVDSTRLKFLIDSKVAPVDVFEVTLSELHLTGLTIDDFLSKRKIDLNVINLVNPRLQIYHGVGVKDSITNDTSTLYERIAGTMGHFAVKNINIRNMDVTYHNLNKEAKITEYNDISMFFADLLIDSTTQYDSSRFLYAKDARIYYHDFTVRTADSLYIFAIDSLELIAAQKRLNLKGLKLDPRGNKAEFSAKHKFYKDRFDIGVASASIENIDWYSLLGQERFFASEITLNDGNIGIYGDQNKPPAAKSKVGNYPHQLLMNLDFPVQVPIVNLNRFKVDYEEVNPKNQRTGNLIFDKITGKITNITNIPENIAVDNFTKIAADCSLMNAGKMTATFSFDLSRAKTGNFSVEGSVGPMDGTTLNPITKPMAMFEVESLKINTIKFNINGTNLHGNGRVLFTYNDLKITALKENESDKLQKKGFLTFLANTFLIQTNNPPKNGKATYKNGSAERDIHRSFFNLIWKTLFSGLKENVTGFET